MTRQMMRAGWIGAVGLILAAAPVTAQNVKPLPAVPPPQPAPIPAPAPPAPVVPVVPAPIPPAPATPSTPFEMPRADPQTTPPPGGPEDSATAIEQGLEGVFNDIFSRAQPHLEGLARDLGGVWGEYAPAFRELTGMMDDIRNYDMPERLENGDIVIRRKADTPPPPPLDNLRGLSEGRKPDGTPLPPPSAVPPSIPVPKIEMVPPQNQIEL